MPLLQPALPLVFWPHICGINLVANVTCMVQILENSPAKSSNSQGGDQSVRAEEAAHPLNISVTTQKKCHRPEKPFSPLVFWSQHCGMNLVATVTCKKGEFIDYTTSLAT